MTHALGIILLIMAIMVHEAGHAIAMMHRGVEIKEAGLGMPITGKLRLTLHLRSLPFPLVITPALIGAYVLPSDRGQRQLETMSYKDRASCYAAGVIMNVAFGAVLVLVSGVVVLMSPAPHDVPRDLFIMGSAFAILVLVVVLRRVLSWVLPLLGTAIMVLLVISFFATPDSIGGPIATVKVAASATSWANALLLGASLSLGLALINMVPMIPLDGGRVMSAMLQSWKLRKINTVYSVVSGLVFTVFIVFVIFQDVVHL